MNVFNPELKKEIKIATKKAINTASVQAGAMGVVSIVVAKDAYDGIKGYFNKLRTVHTMAKTIIKEEMK